jgi:hypothetical protein
MPLMLSKTYEALLAAGAPEDKARGAAEEIAAYESRFTDIERRFGKIEADLLLLKWMVAIVIAITGPALWLLLRVAAKVGALG